MWLNELISPGNKNNFSEDIKLLAHRPTWIYNCRRKIFINSLFSLQAVESLRTIAAEHSSQDLENHFVPLVKRLSQGLLGSCVSQIRNYQAFMSNQGK